MLLKKRKWLTLLMACVCGVSILAGCGNTAQPSESTGTNQTDAASQEGDSTNSDNGSEIKVVMARILLWKGLFAVLRMEKKSNLRLQTNGKSAMTH